MTTQAIIQPSEKHLPLVTSGIWNHPAVIALNAFKFKSLSDFSFNTAVGCLHGCRFCYVPETSTNKLKRPLGKLGVYYPDAGWGQYVFQRTWDEKAFLASMSHAENIPVEELSGEGHRAVMLSTTTDPYQIISHADTKVGRDLNSSHHQMVYRALELILEKSTLNVRILTRGPLARRHFSLFKRFGHRLLFGMSLPTLNNRLASIYEPHAPAPSKRLETLQAAKDAGLHVYVAVAPTYPECDEADLRTTLEAVAKLDPVTVFHEPINIRAENVERIRLHGASIGQTVNTGVYATSEAWRRYAIDQMKLVEHIAGEVGLGHRLHLWPDASLDSNASLSTYANPLEMHLWIKRWHHRISEWPTAEGPK